MDTTVDGRAAAARVAIVAVVVLVPLRGLLRAEGGPMEEGFMLVFPERVLAGDVPNRDFLHLYGPGSLWVLAGAFKAFGTSIVVERLVALAQQMLVVGVVHTIARPWGPVVATTCAVTSVLFVITPIGLVALAWVGGLGLGLLGLHLATRVTPGGDLDSSQPGRWLVGAGVSCGFALLYRPDLVLGLALGGAIVLRRLDRAQRRALLAGLALGTSPILVHLATAGVGNAVRGMLLEPVFELRDGRTLPVPPSLDDLDGFLQKIAELDVIAWPAPLTSPQQIFAWFFLLLAATAALVVAAIVVRRRTPDRWEGVSLAVTAAFAVGILPQALQRPDSTHLAWVSCLTVALLPISIAELLRWRGVRSGRALAAGTAGVLACIVFLVPFFTLRRYADFAAQTFGVSRSAHEITHRGRTFYYGRADVPAAFEPLAADVEWLTEPGDRLFVGPADLTRTAYVDSFIYFMFPQLDPATHFIEMDPGVADAPGSGMAEDLAGADVVVLATLWDTWTEPNASVEHGSRESTRVLEDDFCLVNDYGEPVLFELYERC